MSWSDIFKYVAVDNPISQAVIISTKAVLQGAQKTGYENAVDVPVATVVQKQDLWQIVGGHYTLIRLAGVSGAVAVGLGVYGRYLLSISDDNAKLERKDIFNSTNRSHFLHTLVLLTTPLMRRPILVGLLITLGIVLFNGDGYYRALTGKKHITPFTTIGSICLMTAWLSVALF